MTMISTRKRRSPRRNSVVCASSKRRKVFPDNFLEKEFGYFIEELNEESEAFRSELISSGILEEDALQTMMRSRSRKERIESLLVFLVERQEDGLVTLYNALRKSDQPLVADFLDERFKEFLPALVSRRVAAERVIAECPDEMLRRCEPFLCGTPERFDKLLNCLNCDEQKKLRCFRKERDRVKNLLLILLMKPAEDIDLCFDILIKDSSNGVCVEDFRNALQELSTELRKRCPQDSPVLAEDKNEAILDMQAGADQMSANCHSDNHILNPKASDQSLSRAAMRNIILKHKNILDNWRLVVSNDPQGVADILLEVAGLNQREREALLVLPLTETTETLLVVLFLKPLEIFNRSIGALKMRLVDDYRLMSLEHFFQAAQQLLEELGSVRSRVVLSRSSRELWIDARMSEDLMRYKVALSMMFSEFVEQIHNIALVADYLYQEGCLEEGQLGNLLACQRGSSDTTSQLLIFVLHRSRENDFESFVSALEKTQLDNHLALKYRSTVETLRDESGALLQLKVKPTIDNALATDEDRNKYDSGITIAAVNDKKFLVEFQQAPRIGTALVLDWLPSKSVDITFWVPTLLDLCHFWNAYVDGTLHRTLKELFLTEKRLSDLDPEMRAAADIDVFMNEEIFMKAVEKFVQEGMKKKATLRRDDAKKDFKDKMPIIGTNEEVPCQHLGDTASADQTIVLDTEDSRSESARSYDVVVRDACTGDEKGTAEEGSAEASVKQSPFEYRYLTNRINLSSFHDYLIAEQIVIPYMRLFESTLLYRRYYKDTFDGDMFREIIGDCIENDRWYTTKDLDDELLEAEDKFCEEFMRTKLLNISFAIADESDAVSAVMPFHVALFELRRFARGAGEFYIPYDLIETEPETFSLFCTDLIVVGQVYIVKRLREAKRPKQVQDTESGTPGLLRPVTGGLKELESSKRKIQLPLPGPRRALEGHSDGRPKASPN